MADAGGVAKLSAGDYSIAATINLDRAKLKLEGTGARASVIRAYNLGAAVAGLAITEDGCTVENLQLAGNGGTGYGVELDGASSGGLSDIHLRNILINSFNLYGVYGHDGHWYTLCDRLRMVSNTVAGIYTPSTGGDQNGNAMTVSFCRFSHGAKGLVWNAAGLDVVGGAFEQCEVGLEIGGDATKTAVGFKIGGVYFEANTTACIRLGDKGDGTTGGAALGGEIGGCYIRFSDGDGIINTDLRNSRIGHNFYSRAGGGSGWSIRTAAADVASEIRRPVMDYGPSTYGLAHVIQADQWLVPSGFLITGAGTGANGFVLTNPKNIAASALSGTKRLMEVDLGGTPYWVELYPTKA